MIIKNLKFKNVKSYGNKIQEITFDDKGGITLLSGTNGAGKSTIQETIDLAVFNQVRGKETSKISLKKFPNRTNKELVVDINFNNNNGDNIEIQRKLAPNGFNIKVNEQEFTERYKLMNPIEREHLIGFDYQTFKSFISLSMNDFLNFTHLKPENKRNLLNRLFNLEEFDDYLSITKELVNQNKREIERTVIDSTNISKELKDYMELIKKNQKQNKTVSTPKAELKEQILDVKSQYAKITIDIKNNDDDISDLLIKIQEQRNNVNNLTNENTKRRTELTEIRNKKTIFEKGNCPYCNTDLVSHDHTIILDNLKIDDMELSGRIIENTNMTSIHKDELLLLNNQVRELEANKRGLRNNLIEITSNAKMLKYKLENYKEDVDESIISDLKKKGQELLVEKKAMGEKIDDMKKETLSLVELTKVLGDKGVRQDIIASLIPPININLKKYLKIVNFPYMVDLDNNFDAIIHDKGEPIDSELLSNGEMRILNLCIAVSYIQMVRKIKNINILFMDEVFQSVHKDNINLLLNLLKDFSLENNIHLILVHHGLEDVDSSFFNRVISVEKDMYSDLRIT